MEQARSVISPICTLHVTPSLPVAAARTPITSLGLQVLSALTSPLRAVARALNSLLIKYPATGTCVLLGSFVILIIKLRRANARIAELKQLNKQAAHQQAPLLPVQTDTTQLEAQALIQSLQEKVSQAEAQIQKNQTQATEDLVCLSDYSVALETRAEELQALLEHTRRVKDCLAEDCASLELRAEEAEARLNEQAPDANIRRLNTRLSNLGEKLGEARKELDIARSARAAQEKVIRGLRDKTPAPKLSGYNAPTAPLLKIYTNLLIIL